MTAQLFRPDRAPECVNGRNHRFTLYTQDSKNAPYRVIALITCKTRKDAELFFRERLAQDSRNCIRRIR
jgi:hypothetical protein